MLVAYAKGMILTPWDEARTDMVQSQHEREAQFQQHIGQGFAEGVLVLNEAGVITDADATAGEILGYEPTELLGLHCHHFWEPEQLPYEVLTINNERPYRTTLRHANGRLVPALLSSTPLATEADLHTLITIMRLDTVEHINEALWHTQRLAGIGTLISSIAHELTNPISIITATCSNMQHDINQNALSTTQLLHYIEMIEQSAWRSVRIMEALRNYALNNDPQTAVTDLNMIVEDALTLLRQQFLKEYNVTIETHLDPTLKSIVCDHNRITQVAINLLTNARDAMMPNGGTIHVKTWAVSASNGRQNDLTEACYAFSISDTGTGIPEELMDKIFNPFFSTKKGSSGTGLGLFISHGSVAQHNGRLLAENNADGGATFTVILPRKQLSVDSIY
jgi:PAS domain S-box-containing protein